MEVDSEAADSNTTKSSVFSSKASLRATILEFVEENGRTYHAYKSGKYLLPNDIAEQERLDLQHHLFLLFLGSLHLAPISETLDFGTGTGIWAIEFAQQYPSATVTGTDLSLMQPAIVPLNCSFKVSDFEDSWQYPQEFDCIHGRALTVAIEDPVSVLTSAFRCLEPGGYLELQDPQMPFLCVDGSFEGMAVQE